MTTHWTSHTLICFTESDAATSKWCSPAGCWKWTELRLLWFPFPLPQSMLGLAKSLFELAGSVLELAENVLEHAGSKFRHILFFQFSQVSLTRNLQKLCKIGLGPILHNFYKFQITETCKKWKNNTYRSLNQRAINAVFWIFTSFSDLKLVKIV